MPDDALIPYTGSLDEMFAHVQSLHKDSVPASLWDAGKEYACWVEYSGNDCAPFTGFFRFRKTRVVIANISARGSEDQLMRKGRMPPIIDACARVNKTVEVESVVNPHLVAFLLALDFDHDPAREGSYVRTFD